MPRPKRTLAEVDTNAEPATAAKKALTGRGKAKGKENEVPVTRKAPVAKAAAKKPTVSKAKKATSKKAAGNETNPEVEVLLTDKIPVAKAATKKPTASKAKKATKATSNKANDKEINSENEVLVTDKIPVPIAASMIQNALRAKKAASEKAKDNETDSSVSHNAPAAEVADIGEKADAESAKAVAAATKSNDKTNDGITLPKSNEPIRPSAPKGTTKASVSNNVQITPAAY